MNLTYEDYLRLDPPDRRLVEAWLTTVGLAPGHVTTVRVLDDTGCLIGVERLDLESMGPGFTGLVRPTVTDTVTVDVPFPAEVLPRLR